MMNERGAGQALVVFRRRQGQVSAAQLEAIVSYNLEAFVVSGIGYNREYGNSQSLRYVHTHGLSQVVDLGVVDVNIRTYLTEARLLQSS